MAHRTQQTRDADAQAAEAWVAQVRATLLAWYGRGRRDLPWRQTSDPYAIWVSEVMLQQTQVETVRPYYARWLRRWPSVAQLAEADEASVLGLWQGLGYYRRARSLLRAAQLVIHEHAGQLPTTAAGLRNLPGVGRYTAAAIASIAYGERTPAIDGNVVRVLSRLRGLAGDPSRAPTKHSIEQLAGRLVSHHRAGDCNQALMELGATVCRPRKPHCRSCPLRRWCAAQRDNRSAALPETATRPGVTRLQEVAAIAVRGGRWLVVQLPHDAPRYALLWRFPCVELAPGEDPEGATHRALESSVGLRADVGSIAVRLRYSVTRFSVILEARHCHNLHGRARRVGCANFAWKTSQQLETLAMPAPHRKIIQQLTARSRQPRREHVHLFECNPRRRAHR